MDKIREDLQQLYINCEVVPECDCSVFDNTMDKIDYILNIIEATSVHSMVDCTLAIKKMKRLLSEDE